MVSGTNCKCSKEALPRKYDRLKWCNWDVDIIFERAKDFMDVEEFVQTYGGKAD